MSTVALKLDNGNTVKYKERNGTYYHYETNEKVINALEYARKNNRRIRIYFGDTESGQSWYEEHDVMGYVKRSLGKIKIPLLIPRKDSHGGIAILDNCIVKIVDTRSKTTLYEHESFRVGEFELYENNNELKEKGYLYGVKIDGKNYANFKTKEQAKRWIAFMKGERNSK